MELLLADSYHFFTCNLEAFAHNAWFQWMRINNSYENNRKSTSPRPYASVLESRLEMYASERQALLISYFPSAIAALCLSYAETSFDRFLTVYTRVHSDINTHRPMIRGPQLPLCTAR